VVSMGGVEGGPSGVLEVVALAGAEGGANGTLEVVVVLVFDVSRSGLASSSSFAFAFDDEPRGRQQADSMPGQSEKPGLGSRSGLSRERGLPRTMPPLSEQPLGVGAVEAPDRGVGLTNTPTQAKNIARCGSFVRFQSTPVQSHRVPPTTPTAPHWGAVVL
jgi:hypothetical protein